MKFMSSRRAVNSWSITAFLSLLAVIGVAAWTAARASPNATIRGSANPCTLKFNPTFADTRCVTNNCAFGLCQRVAQTTPTGSIAYCECGDGDVYEDVCMGWVERVGTTYTLWCDDFCIPESENCIVVEAGGGPAPGTYYKCQCN